MRLLVTRPREEAEATADALRELGHEAVVEPLLTIRFADAALPPLEGYQALLISSINGLRAFTRLSPDRGLPVFAVGPASAAEARAAGFAVVHSADGDAQALAALVGAHLSPADGALLQPSGGVVAGGLRESLRTAGFTLDQPILYRAEAATAFSAPVRTDLAAGALDGVLLFSPRSARTFASLARASALDASCARMVAFCLSPAVAAAARDGLAWQGVRVADHPNQAALLRCLKTEERPRTGPEDVMDQKPNEDGGDGTPAERVIARFGGLRPMAHKLEIPVSTVQGWKNRGQIPPSRHAEIRAAAERHGISLDEGELLATGGDPDQIQSAEPQQPAPEPITAAPAIDTSLREDEVGVPPAGAAAEEARAPEADGRAAPVEASWAPQQESRPQGGGQLVLGLLLGAGVLLGGAVIAVLARDVWLPWVGQPSSQALEEVRARSQQLGSDLSALSRKVDQLPTQQSVDGEAIGRQVSSLEQQVSALQKSVADQSAVNAVAEQVNGVKQQVGNLQQALDQSGGKLSGLEQQLATLSSQVDGLKQRLDQDRMRAGGAIALVLAADQLRSEAAQGTAFADSLATLRDLAGDDGEVAPQLERLQARATTGVPSLPELRVRFEALSPEALAASQGSGSELGAAIMDRVSSLISIRPTGQAVTATDTSADLLARAQGALDRGDLEAAVAAVEQLPEDGKQVLAGWLQDARARIEVRQALDAIQELALRRLAQLRG